MATLTLSFHDKQIDEIELVDDYTTIGRKAENNIQIDNLAVSGYHARVIKVLNDYFIEDLNSTNGVLINDQPVTRATLHTADIITVGKHQLLFSNDDQQEESDDLEKTVVMKPSSLSAMAHGRNPDQAAPIEAEKPDADEVPAAPPVARLQILSGSNSGRDLALTKQIMKIGRKGVQVLAITQRNERYYLVSIEEGKGENRYPLVNGLPAGPQAWLLHDQDVIEIAGIKMGFFAPA